MVSLMSWLGTGYSRNQYQEINRIVEDEPFDAK